MNINFAKIFLLIVFCLIPSMSFSGDLTLGPCSPRDSQESSPAPPFESINSSVLRLL